MKKRIVMGLAIIGASVAVLCGCGGNTTLENETTIADITIPNEMTEGFEAAAFAKYNSPAEKNGLANTKVRIEGTVGQIETIDGAFYTNVKADDGTWTVILDSESFQDKATYELLEGKKIAVSGVYQGYSEVAKQPVIYAIRIFDYSTGNIIASALGKILYESGEEIPTETTTTIQETTTETTTRETTTETTTIKETTEATTTTTVVSRSAVKQETTYVLNTSSKKFHYSGCREVNKMKDKNKKVYEGTREEVINMGYDPCGVCNP